MDKSQLTGQKVGLIKFVSQIKYLTPELPAGFDDSSHKTCYLRRAVIGHEFAVQQTSQLTTAKYTFTQFITALHESIQLKDEIPRSKALYIR